MKFIPCIATHCTTLTGNTCHCVWWPLPHRKASCFLSHLRVYQHTLPNTTPTTTSYSLSQKPRKSKRRTDSLVTTRVQGLGFPQGSGWPVLLHSTALVTTTITTTLSPHNHTMAVKVWESLL